MTSTLPAKHFVLFDGRAKSLDTDDAVVMDVADSEHEAIAASRSHRGVDAIWYEYKLTDGTKEPPVYEEVGPRFDIGKGVLA